MGRPEANPSSNNELQTQSESDQQPQNFQYIPENNVVSAPQENFPATCPPENDTYNQQFRPQINMAQPQTETPQMPPTYTPMNFPVGNTQHHLQPQISMGQTPQMPTYTPMNLTAGYPQQYPYQYAQPQMNMGQTGQMPAYTQMNEAQQYTQFPQQNQHTHVTVYAVAPQPNQPQPVYHHNTPPHVIAYPATAPSLAWTTGLFDCFDDPINALVTICVPCLTFGQIAEIVDHGHTSCGTQAICYCLLVYFLGLPCLISCTYRTKLRNMFNLVESPCPDWMVHVCCEYCALCQEYRELQNNGLNPSLGWHGNQRPQPLVLMAPPTTQTMVG